MAYAIVLALFDREKTGKGKRIEIALLDVAIMQMGQFVAMYTMTGELPQRMGSGYLAAAPYQAFETQDGYVLIAVTTDEMWKNLCRVLKLDHLYGNPKYSSLEGRVKSRPELAAEVSQVTRQYRSKDLETLLVEGSVPCGRLMNIDEIIADPHVQFRNIMADVEDPKRGKIKIIKTPIFVSGAPPGSEKARPPDRRAHRRNSGGAGVYSGRDPGFFQRQGGGSAGTLNAAIGTGDITLGFMETIDAEEFYNRLAAAFDIMTDWPKRLAFEMPFLEKTLRAHAARSVLDTACGTGWHSIALAQKGYAAAGADASPAMIERARQNAAASARQRSFEVADFSRLENVPGTFDALLCLGNSLPHVLSEPALRETFRQMKSKVKPGGVIIIHNLNYDLRWKKQPRFFAAEGNAEMLVWRFADYGAEFITFHTALFERRRFGPFPVVREGQQHPAEALADGGTWTGF